MYRLDIESVGEIVRMRRLSWFEHVERISEGPLRETRCQGVEQ